MSDIVRPTKKQRDLLTYIEQFIVEHGYSPSYREIMNGLDYNSVATVALHVNSLITRGHLRKRDRSARSLEVVNPEQPGQQAGQSSATDSQAATEAQGEAWLVARIEKLFAAAEQSGVEESPRLHQLIAALRTLGLPNAADNLEARLPATAPLADGNER